MFKKQLNEGQAGDNVGLLLRGIKRDDVVRGQVTLRPEPLNPGLTQTHAWAGCCRLRTQHMLQLPCTSSFIWDSSRVHQGRRV